MVFGDENELSPKPIIKVIGTGGAGVNFVDRMINYDIKGVEFIAVNTDTQSLRRSYADQRVQIGRLLTKGIGAGTDPEVGKEAALESENDLREIISDADMVFLVTGFGGGTGTGSAPVIARLCKEADILTVAVVTKPFANEGSQRMDVAIKGLDELRRYVDTLIVVPNQNIYSIIDPSTPLLEAYREIDDVIRQAVQSVADLINTKGIINIDLADVKKFMKNKGTALMGIGVASGPDRAIQATRNAISSKLLEVSIDGATDAIVNITADQSLTAYEFDAVLSEIRNCCHSDLNIKPGQTISRLAGDELIVTIIATGYELKAKEKGIGDIATKIFRKNSVDQMSFDDFDMKNLVPSVGEGIEMEENNEEENTDKIFHKKKRFHLFGKKDKKKEDKKEIEQEEPKKETKKESECPEWL